MKGFLTTVKGKIIAAAVTAAIAGSVVTSAIFINLGYRTIAVKALNGITQIFNGDKEDYAYEGLHLKSGDNVNVNSNSDLTLSLDEDKYVYAEPETRFWVEAAGKLGDTRTTIHLEEGSQLFRIDNKLEGDEYFNVQTPNSTMSVRGTVFRVSCRYDENGELITSVEVFEGEVLAEPVYLHDEKPGEESGNKTGESQIIAANYKAMIRADESLSEFVVDEMGEIVTELQIEDYEDIPSGAGEFLGEAIDSGRDICIKKDLLYDYVKINECVFELRHDEVAPACTEEGHYYPKCSVCGKVQKEIVKIPVKEHTLTEENVPGAVCGEPGVQYIKCSECGIVTAENPLPEKEHTYDEGQITKAATNKSTGIKTYTCLDCGNTREEEIPKVESQEAAREVSADKPSTTPAPAQTPKQTPTTEPQTPTTKPNPTPTPSKESQTPSTNPNPTTEPSKQTPTDPCATGHKYEQVDSKEATCNEDGYVLYRCSVCKAEDKSPRTKLSHKYAEDTSQRVDATCIAEGKKVEKCSLCGNTITTSIEKKSHKYVEDSSKYKEPTCTEYGYKYKVCSVCDDETKTRISKTKHDYKEDATKKVEPTCTATGYTVKICSKCGDEVRTEIAKISHDYKEDTSKRIEPTCTSEGAIYNKCSMCGNERRDTIAKLPHDYKENAAKRVEPTCTAAGYTVKVCTMCDDEIRTTVAKLGHEYLDAPAKYVAPTCLVAGVSIEECSRCGDEIETEIDALGHDLKTDKIDATCVKDGSRIVTCEREGCLYKDTTILPALGHSYILRQAKTVEGTCTEKGSETYECTKCNDEDIRETDVDLDNHDYEVVTGSASYVASLNKYEHEIKCSRCEDTKKEDCRFTASVCKCGYNNTSKPEATLKSGSDINLQLKNTTFLNGNTIETIKRSEIIPDGANYKNIAKEDEEPVNIWVDDTGALNFHSEAQDIVISDAKGLFSGINTLRNADISFMKLDSSCTSLANMFNNCDRLTSVDLSGIDTSNITDMSRMFEGCTNLQTVDVSKFDTSKVTTFDSMFDSCNSLTVLDVSGFITTNATDLNHMFQDCQNVSKLDVSRFNTSKVTNMCGLFEGCRKLENVDVSKFDTSKVTNMYFMFADCSSLTTLDVTNFNTEKVEDMWSMFGGCSSLTSLDLSSFDTANVTDMHWMFRNCTSLETIYVSENFKVSTGCKTEDMFENCSVLTGGKGTTIANSGLDIAVEVNNAYLAWPDGVTVGDSYATQKAGLGIRGKGLFTSKVSFPVVDSTKIKAGSEINSIIISDSFLNGNTTKSIVRVEDMSSAINEVNIAMTGEEPVYIWAADDKLNFYSAAKDIIVSDPSRMFKSKVSLVNADLSFLKLDPSATSMLQMFNGCEKLENVDLSSFDTSNISSMTEMFNGCFLLTSVDFGDFGSSKITSMSSMFYSCAKLTSLDLSHFDTSNVTTMESMFSGCSRLRTVYVGDKYSLKESCNVAHIFNGTTGLIGKNGTKIGQFNVEELKITYEQLHAYLAWPDGVTVGDPYATQKATLGIAGKGLFTLKGESSSGGSYLFTRGASMSYTDVKSILAEAMNYNIIANELVINGEMEASFATKMLSGNSGDEIGTIQGPASVTEDGWDYTIIGECAGSNLRMIVKDGDHMYIETTYNAINKFGMGMTGYNIGQMPEINANPRFPSGIMIDYNYSKEELNSRVDALLTEVRNASSDFEHCVNKYSFEDVIDINAQGGAIIDTSSAENGTYVIDLSSEDKSKLSNMTIKKKENQVIVFNISDEIISFGQYNFEIIDSTGNIKYSGNTSGSILEREENVTKTVVFNAPKAQTVTFDSTTDGIFIIPSTISCMENSVAAGWIYAGNASLGGQEWHGYSANRAPIPDVTPGVFSVGVKLNNNYDAGGTPHATFELYETEAEYWSGMTAPIDTIEINDYSDGIGTLSFKPDEYSIGDIGTHYYVIKATNKPDDAEFDYNYAHIKVTVMKRIDAEGNIIYIDSMEYSHEIEEHERVLKNPQPLPSDAPMISFNLKRSVG